MYVYVCWGGAFYSGLPDVCALSDQGYILGVSLVPMLQ